MKRLPIVAVHNRTTGTLLAGKAIIADTFLSRLRGLLGRTCLPENEGLIIRPCNQVHMMGMKFPIDVIYVSRENEVLVGVSGLRPWAIGPYVRKAAWVLELPAGMWTHSGSKPGDMLEISSPSTGKT